MLQMKIGKIDISHREINKLMARIEQRTNGSIEFKGRYPLLREFGMPPMLMDAAFIAEMTKMYIDNGYDHATAREKAMNMAAYIETQGFPARPFVRPALDSLMMRMQGRMTTIEQLESLLDDIAKRAKEIFDKDSDQMNEKIRLDYEIKRKK